MAMTSSHPSFSLQEMLPALQAAESFYHTVEGQPVLPRYSSAEIRNQLESTFCKFETPVPLEPLSHTVSELLQNGLVHVTHPRYFGLFNPSVHTASVLADTLVAAYNPQLAAWSHAPAANEIEQFTLRVLLKALGFPLETSAANFTSGGAEANQSAVLCALVHYCPQYLSEGARGIPKPPVMYCSEETHHSVLRAAKTAGLGEKAVRSVPMDETLQLKVDVMRAMIAEDRAAGCLPFMIVGTAGTTSCGAIDPLSALAQTAQELGLWFHVDAAWGGTAVLSARLNPYLTGIEQADSVTWDAHKWLSAPMGAGMFFCRHRQTVARTFGLNTAYMPPGQGDNSQTPDPYMHSIQWSRRCIGLKVFMMLANLGLPQVEALIDHQADMGDYLKRALREHGWTTYELSPLPVVNFTHPDITAIDAAPKTAHAAVLEALYEAGDCWISQTRLHGIGECFRACITSYQTQPKDVDRLLSTLNQALSKTLAAA